MAISLQPHPSREVFANRYDQSLMVAAGNGGLVAQGRNAILRLGAVGLAWSRNAILDMGATDMARAEKAGIDLTTTTRMSIIGMVPAKNGCNWSSPLIESRLT